MAPRAEADSARRRTEKDRSRHSEFHRDIPDAALFQSAHLCGAGLRPVGIPGVGASLFRKTCRMSAASGPLKATVRGRSAGMGRAEAEQVVTDLFESCYAAMVRYAASRCGSVDLAEEFVQEAFGSLYASLRDGAIIRQPRAWLLKAVHNQICKSWRRAGSRHEVAMPRLELESVPYATDGGGGTGGDTGETLEGLLALLTPREREVILLRAHGFKYREIASQLAISSNSVGTLVLRGLRKIRAARAERILRSVGETASA